MGETFKKHFAAIISLILTDNIMNFGEIWTLRKILYKSYTF